MTIDLSVPFRLAHREDGAVLAQLINFAGYGLPLHVWEQMAGSAQDPWKVGQTRLGERAAKGDIVVADFGAGAVASLECHYIDPAPQLPGEDTPLLFRPLVELEGLAPGSWYVNAIAVLPEYRGKGLGRQLLDVADRQAASRAVNEVSLIVADRNEGARRLYERSGFRETARRPCIHDGWKSEMREWILMKKSI